MVVQGGGFLPPSSHVQGFCPGEGGCFALCSPLAVLFYLSLPSHLPNKVFSFNKRLLCYNGLPDGLNKKNRGTCCGKSLTQN